VARSGDRSSRFDVAMRGYDQRQVDTYLERLERGEERPSGRVGFTLTLRGYDRHQVDAHLQRLERGEELPPS
jgi:DivIVA domain-containing protein